MYIYIYIYSQRASPPPRLSIHELRARAGGEIECWFVAKQRRLNGWFREPGSSLEMCVYASNFRVMPGAIVVSFRTTSTLGKGIYIHYCCSRYTPLFRILFILSPNGPYFLGRVER